MPVGESERQRRDVPMNHIPGLDSIEERLRHALEQIAAFPGLGEQVIGASLSGGQIERTVGNMLRMKNKLFADVSASLDVQKWVEVHWDAERQTQPPAGTVSDGDKWGNQGEVQLDALTATFKLLLAAAGHGAETVAKCAVEFAAHGMIEIRIIYPLKAASVSNAKPLDDYCTLLPYQEALQKVNTDPYARELFEYLQWPPESADDVCALETRSFERRGLMADEFERRVSILLQFGPDTLALILGLVWGTGFRVFGRWHDVTEPVAATLPFFRTAGSSGGAIQETLLPLPGFKRPSTNRPLNTAELTELMGKYAALSEKTQRVLNLALRRLQDSTERMNVDDKVIDLGIALEALFSKGSEESIQKTVPSRGAWYFSDSPKERAQTSKLLQEFYKERSHIVHGNVSRSLAKEQIRKQARQHMITDIANVVRASLKTMISEGLPPVWGDRKNPQSIWRNPSRAATEIPATKSDSLSWTVAEQNEIDKALEAVWKPTVDNAPAPHPDASFGSHHGVNREQIEQYKQQGIYYILRIPALLYMAHPKWIERADEPLDDHTRYYCEKDVERHLERWQNAAAEKKVHQFALQLENATVYLPKHFDLWRKLVSEEPEQESN